MRFWTTVPVFITLLHARDDEKLALSLKAQTDFDRVALAASPTLADTATCTQSLAAILAVSAPDEQSAFHYRKGYCLLAGAAVTRSRQDYASAAGEFDRAIEAWPQHIRKPVKNAPLESPPAGVRVLSAVAHLFAEGEAGAKAALAAAVSNPSCAAGMMAELACRQWIETGRLWLGHMALRTGNTAEAVADFSGAGDTGWLDWAQGLQLFESGNYAQAAARYAAAIDTWKAVWNGPARSFVRQMGPRPDVSTGLVDLGGAQMVAGNPQQALKTLDEALKLDPAAARAYFLRARTREIAGHANEALADYNLAARAAFAASEDLVSGEAHLYRGILMFRRKDYARAEDEFSSALNFSIGGALRPDAEAWRQLAAVASGSCATARQTLERSLPAVSPFFPKQEARAIAAACSVSAN